MQRDACARSSPSGYGKYTSRQSCTRSPTGRYGCFCRWISMNPVALPMNDLEIREHDWRDLHLAELRFALEHTFVIARHHFDEHLPRDGPLRQDLRCQGASRVANVPFQQFLHELRLVICRVLLERLEIDEFRIASRRESRVRIVNIGDAAAHACCEITPGLPEDDDATASHVLATVIADAFDHG